ncbi:MAG TPA: hydantoinase/oxoprolinase family protein [Gammaproteobacteria bacterium]|nr:hydantoinase/oxoprolinase family protein [Gammaproteobacteria bacterium]
MIASAEGTDGLLLLGVDTGGTFTDFVLLSDGRLRVHKVLSTPEAPERAILQGVADLGLDAQRRAATRVYHGSTVATNAVLEGRGVPTAYIANRGLGDVLSIARQARQSLYDLQPPRPVPPVPREWCLQTGGRVGADGSTVEPLTDEDLADLTRALERIRPGAVAINLLFSWLDDTAERAIEAAVPEGIFVSRSSAVLPEYREYERGITTWLNAYVGPLVAGYLRRLGRRVAPAPVAVMQSSGETIDAGQAADRAVHMLLSGPAGGLAGARFIGALAGHQRLMTFDMGGTSTDVALIDGDLRLTSEGSIGPYPLCVPTVDMHTIGAGGGSIARVDEGGLLRVGPRSAGADPGPASYGRGGSEPTVTDANLVLGRLLPDVFLGGAMRLDVDAARTALARIATPLGLSVEAAAEGVIRLANDHMGRALRVISVQRGEDPRDFVLTCFGGAGGLHVCAVAESLGMSRAMVPIHAGVLSALGMLAAPRGRQLSRTVNGLLREMPVRRLAGAFAELEAEGRSQLEREGVRGVATDRSMDLRYRGQSYTLNVAADEAGAAERAFHRAHAARYGHALDLPAELVNVRVNVRGPSPEISLQTLPPAEPGREPPTHARLHGFEAPVPVWPRAALGAGARVAGPALVTETVSTTCVAPGWEACVDAWGNLLLYWQEHANL